MIHNSPTRHHVQAWEKPSLLADVVAHAATLLDEAIIARDVAAISEGAAWDMVHLHMWFTLFVQVCARIGCPEPCEPSLADLQRAVDTAASASVRTQRSVRDVIRLLSSFWHVLQQELFMDWDPVPLIQSIVMSTVTEFPDFLTMTWFPVWTFEVWSAVRHLIYPGDAAAKL